MQKQQIEFHNRYTGKREWEKIYGDQMVRWLYQSTSGRPLGRLLALPLLSKIYGAMQSSPWGPFGSAGPKKVSSFIKKFNISMDEYLPEEGALPHRPFSTFNNFFIRRFSPGARPFVQDLALMPAFAEARYFAYESLTPEQRIPVKGKYLSAEAVIGNFEMARPFVQGPVLLARLCPVDYHRFHYPDEGECFEHFRVAGKLHSVNPLALSVRQDVFCTNERKVSLLKTKNFGRLAYVEVGAICVGKIVQTHKDKKFFRGGEKGHFLFGASTIILFGSPGQWIPDKDLLDNTARGVETFVKLGDCVARRC